MIKIRTIAGLVLGSWAGIAVAGAAAGDSIRVSGPAQGKDHDEALEGVDEGRLVPLEDIVEAIARLYEGELIDASLHEIVPGEPIYRVIWLTPDNRKLTILADALTGEILKVVD